MTSLFHVADVNCWQEWLIYSDIFFLLMKSGCIDFVDFLDKLILCITKEYNQEILKTNHVTWLLAQIIRIELVMTTLSTDSRRVKLFFFFHYSIFYDGQLIHNIYLNMYSIYICRWRQPKRFCHSIKKPDPRILIIPKIPFLTL